MKPRFKYKWPRTVALPDITLPYKDSVKNIPDRFEVFKLNGMWEMRYLTREECIVDGK